jgi:hypothetical protein
MAKGDPVVKRGERFLHTFPGGFTGEVVAIGTVDRYVALRRPGAAPFLLTMREFSKLPRVPTTRGK